MVLCCVIVCVLGCVVLVCLLIGVWICFGGVLCAWFGFGCLWLPGYELRCFGVFDWCVVFVVAYVLVVWCYGMVCCVIVVLFCCGVLLFLFMVTRSASVNVSVV